MTGCGRGSGFGYGRGSEKVWGGVGMFWEGCIEEGLGVSEGGWVEVWEGSGMGSGRGSRGGLEQQSPTFAPWPGLM